MVRPFSFDNDPFADLDDEQAEREENDEQSELISRVQAENARTIQNLIHCEDHIPTCQEFHDETWEEEFTLKLDHLANHSPKKSQTVKAMMFM